MGYRLTNSVYPPRRDASEGAVTQRRQMSLFGLNRHPEQMLVGDIGICRLGVLWHAQIMTSDAAHVWLGARPIAGNPLEAAGQDVQQAVNVSRPGHSLAA